MKKLLLMIVFIALFCVQTVYGENGARVLGIFNDNLVAEFTSTDNAVCHALLRNIGDMAAKNGYQNIFNPDDIVSIKYKYHETDKSVLELEVTGNEKCPSLMVYIYFLEYHEDGHSWRYRYPGGYTQIPRDKIGDEYFLKRVLDLFN